MYVRRRKREREMRAGTMRVCQVDYQSVKGGV